jgi:hypothetical protein
VTSSAYSRPRARPRRRVGPGRPGWASRSTIGLALAPSSPCPACGRTTKTVQGVCADCWASKGGRQFWVRRHGGSDSLVEEFLGLGTAGVIALAAVIASIPAAIILLRWIWG